jgi:hypothetical protein
MNRSARTQPVLYKQSSFLIVSLLFLLIAVVPVYAIDNSLTSADYIVAVSASAPSTDVIAAANFAASMKASYAVTFKSALDTDLSRVVVDDFEKNTIVLMDAKDKRALIVQGSAVASSEFLQVAGDYLSEQGFDVSTFVTGVPYAGRGKYERSAHYTKGYLVSAADLSFPIEPKKGLVKMLVPRELDVDGEIVLDETSVKNNTDDEQEMPPRARADETMPVTIAVDGAGEDQSLTSQVPPAPEERTRAPVEKSGVFTRVWSWFAGLFG